MHTKSAVADILEKNRIFTQQKNIPKSTLKRNSNPAWP